MIPPYVDISHFRAPFKNAVFGEVQPLPAAIAPFVDAEPDGLLVYKPAVADQVLKSLAVMSVIALGENDATVEPTQAEDPRQSALAWVETELGKGRSVLFGASEGIAAAMMPVAGVTKLLRSVTGHEAELLSAGPSTSQYAVLARPRTMTSSLGPLGVGLVALAVGGIVWYVLKAGAKGSRS